MEFDVTNVLMNQVKCVSGNNSLIGTKAIASCIGVLLYDKLNKKAIVGHFNSNMYDGPEVEDANRIYNELCNAIIDNNLSNDIVYLVVPGLVGNVDRIKNVSIELEKYLAIYKKMENIEDDSIKINVETESLEFVFDPNYGVFATNIFYPNDNNYKLNDTKTR